MKKAILLKNATVITMNKAREVLNFDILVEANKIARIAKSIELPDLSNVEVLDLSSYFILPGFIQTHIHLCQTLARGDADDKVLLEWLKTSIWPMEANHDKSSIQASAKLSILEMHLAGTTSILDMGTTRHTNDLFEAVAESQLRYWGGNCMMDHKTRSGPLYLSTSENLEESEQLLKEWNNKNPLIQYALCPRFAVSSTKDLLLATLDLQKKYDLLVHTHASESLEEVALINKETGFDNIDYLDHLGLLNEKLVLVHGVHINDNELKRMLATKTKLVHCPSSNLKLASGFAPIHKYKQAGLSVGLGADGAPCNNNLNPLFELRLAALLQKPLFGPTAMNALESLELLTTEGAKVLGAEKFIGSIEEGKLADLVCIHRDSPHMCTIDNPYSSVVYSAQSQDVHHVMVDGKWVVKNSRSQVFDQEATLYSARQEKKSLMARINHG